jgi:type IV pilus assembly protein PilC|tara:strand:+ start:1355 stop:2590 length:1236 start_codon:yes stop_codon:yes gene_type:complete
MNNKLQKFSYIAFNNDEDNIVRDKIKASNEKAALLQIQQLGLEPLNIKKEATSILDIDVVFFEKITPNHVYNFTRQLSVMLKAGVPLVEAIDSLHSDSAGPLVNRIIDTIIEDISGGTSLSMALKKHPKMFDSMYYNIVRAGESAGVLDKVLFQLADFIASDLKLRMGIKQATRYPAIVVGITVLVGIFAVTFILPQFSTLFSNSKIALPLPTRILLGADKFITEYWYLLILIIGFIIGLTKVILRSKKGSYAWHKTKIKLGIIGPISLKMSISRFIHVLETLDRTGVPILDSLKIAGKTTGNTYIEKNLSKVHQDVRMGKKLAFSLTKFTTGIFPSQMLKMIQVGENAGALSDMLKEIGEMMDAEVKDHVLKLTATLEPLISIFMGFMVLGLALSIFLPIWDMYEAISTS